MKKPNELVKELMKKEGINKNVLSQRTGININTIRAYIDSWNNIPIENLYKIAQALKVNVSYLLGEITDDEIEVENTIKTFLQSLKEKKSIQIYYEEIKNNLFLIKIDK